MATQAYYDAMTALMRRVLPILARSLGLGPDHFDPLFSRPIASLRPLHYRLVGPSMRCMPAAGMWGRPLDPKPSGA